MRSEEIASELNRLKSDIADLRDGMASLLRALKDAGVDQGRDVYNRATERARRAGERADETYSNLGRKVKKRPLTSVLTALGTGFVVGMLLDRRR